MQPPAQPRHAIVMGAGIGGLTAAIALGRRGWQVTVHERAASLDPVGSGLGIAPNALRALDSLGVGGEIRALAAVPGDGGLRRSTGRWLGRTSGEALAEVFGDTVAVMHRADMVRVLADRLPDGVLHMGSTVQVLDPGSDQRPATVSTSTGRQQADLVVAADGIGSRTRELLFPEHPGPRYCGFTAWRTVIPAAAAAIVGDVPIGETWGRGAVTGIMPLADGRIYLYAAALAAAGGRAHDDERAELVRRFGPWCAPLPQLIAAAEPEQVLRNDVYEMTEALPSFCRGRVALLGDAAHAMTPFLGQGACQAIEDAVVLASLVSPAESTEPTESGDNLPAALAAYCATRLPRTSMVVQRSRRISRAVAIHSRPAVLLRDLGLALGGLLPEKATARAVAPVFDWRPPA
jgi:2-polyprenyl-6-methoxyphenol hydroxylase-like FAD-dependent oxidoreductase